MFAELFIILATQVTLYHTVVRPHACSASYSCATFNNSLLPKLLLLSRTMPSLSYSGNQSSVFFQFILERLRSFLNLGRIISVLFSFQSQPLYNKQILTSSLNNCFQQFPVTLRLRACPINVFLIFSQKHAESPLRMRDIT